MQEFSINAQLRSAAGKGENRRMRRSGRVPAVIYGGNGEAVSLSLDHNEVSHHLENEAFYSHILTMDVDGKEEMVILRDLQRHPSKPQILHMDFFRVTADREITVNVPLHFLNEETCIGVKQQGGIVSHLQKDVEISCLPKHLPEYLEIDISGLELGHSLHLSDVVLPEGLTIVALTHGGASDHAIVAVIKPKVALREDEAEAEAGEGEGEGEGAEGAGDEAAKAESEDGKKS